MRTTKARAALVFPLFFTLGSFGCNAERSAGSTLKTPIKSQTTATKASPSVPAGHLSRGEVDRVLTQQGPPWILRRVMSEEVFGKDGKFAGWRLVGLPEEWSGIDLRPGDVVRRVNGKSLETPEDAWEAWKSVAQARELRIRLERNGADKEIVIPIDGEPKADVLRTLEQGPLRRTPGQDARGAVQIGGEAPSGDWEGEDTY